MKFYSLIFFDFSEVHLSIRTARADDWFQRVKDYLIHGP